MHYIGIDPGVSGGIAVLSEGGQVIDATKMLDTERELLNWVDERARWFGNSHEGRAFAMLERVNAGVFGHGKAGKMGAVSAMTFGRNVGHLEMMLAALEIPFDYITPAKWQQVMGCRSAGDKNVTKRRAQQLFPHQKVTHAIADALLIAEFGRRVRGQHGETGQGSEGAKARRGESREEFERDRFGETGDRIALDRKAAEEHRASLVAALAGPAGHGAGSRQGPRQSLRGHQRRAHREERG